MNYNRGKIPWGRLSSSHYFAYYFYSSHPSRLEWRVIKARKSRLLFGNGPFSKGWSPDQNGWESTATGVLNSMPSSCITGPTGSATYDPGSSIVLKDLSYPCSIMGSLGPILCLPDGMWGWHPINQTYIPLKYLQNMYDNPWERYCFYRYVFKEKSIRNSANGDDLWRKTAENR